MNFNVQGSPFSDEILDKTVGAIRTFLAEIANGSRQYLTIHNLTEQIEHQYHERFIIELLQNAHDALQAVPTARPRRIAFVLDKSAGAHGVLYVANDGRAFRREDLRALSNLGQSSKDPRESIGNKGIGFRSVLEVCDSPEIYSCADEKRGAFDGYCFRFTPDVLDSSLSPLTRLLGGEDAVEWQLGDRSVALEDIRASHLRARCQADNIDLIAEFRHLSPYLLPLPISASDDKLRYFASEGFATVVRLPLSSAEAHTATVARLRELDPDTVVFLDGLDSLTVDDGGLRRHFERHEVRAKSGHETSVTVRDGIDEVEFRRWKYVLRNQEALRQATAKLPGRWKELTEAPLGIALRVRGAPAPGRFFIYLPTEVPTGTRAILHAPFFGEMNRKTIQFSEPLNDLLRRNLKNCLIAVVREHLAGRGELEARAIIDALAPLPEVTSDFPAEILAAFGDLAIVLTDNGWRSTASARLMPIIPHAAVFADSRLRACARFDAVHSSLDDRRSLVTSLLRARGTPVTPTDLELAATIEAVAANNRGAWDDFWTEVQELLPNKAQLLANRRVLVDDDGALHPSGAVDGVQVFYPRFLTDTGTEPAALEISPSLKSRIAFLSGEISLRRRRPDGREESNNTRRFLDHLVEEYRVETILRAVLTNGGPHGSVALRGPDAVVCEDTLDFVVRLLRGPREAAAIPELKRLRLPCNGGWFLPDQCVFGPGWAGTCGDILNEYLQELLTESAFEVYDRLLLDPSHPAWHGHAEWLKDRLPAMGVRDGLFPTPAGADWQGTFSMQIGSPVGIPAAPPGFSQVQWLSYATAVVSEIRPNYSGWFSYKLVDVFGLVGLESLDTISAVGRRALTRLLFRSIHRWPHGWQASRFRKVHGASHEGAITSFLLHFLRESPWIWCEQSEPATGFAPSTRWFVRATLERSQRRQYDHLGPLPPDITSDLVSLGPNALAAMSRLGMPTLDLDTPTSDSRLLVDLADAFEHERVTPAARNVFIGQVRDAWRVFHPTENDNSLGAVVVVRSGRLLGVHRPSADEPLYVPDVTVRSADLGPFGALPLAVMETRDAVRLLPYLRRRFPGGAVRAISALRTEVLVAGEGWRRGLPSTRLMSSAMHWLATLALAASAFAGHQAHGAQTKEFKQRVAAMRAVSIECVCDLSIRVVDVGEVGTPSRVAAFWDAQTQTLLCDIQVPGWVEALAGPIGQALDRVDVITSLRYALSKLPADRDPSPSDLERAADAIEISPSQLAEIRLLCTGDHTWICERLRPAVALLAPNASWPAIEGAESGEALERQLVSALPSDVEAAVLVEMARECRDDRAMGIRLFDHVGPRAELEEWNRVLQVLGTPYRTLANPLADEQFVEHKQSLLLPLRALGRQLCLEGPGWSFLTFAERLRSCLPPADLGTNHWTVPFDAALAAIVAAAFDGAPLKEAHISALSRATSVDELILALQHVDPSIEPTRDPAETHRENVILLQRSLSTLRRAALAWCHREKAALGKWLEPDDMAGPVRARIDGDEGYLRIWTEGEMLGALAACLPRDPSHGGFWNAVNGIDSHEALRVRLGLSEADLAQVDRIVQAARDQARRVARTLIVCGAPFEAEADNLSNLWSHISQLVNDAALPAIDPMKTAALKPVPTTAPRPPGRAGGGRGGRRPRRTPEDQARVIGLAGEIFAYRMLQRHFGESVVSPAVWVSENSRHCFPDNDGDDGLGYDFRIVVKRKTWLIEVKATVGADTCFELGPTEVQTAMAASHRKGQVYRVLHIQNVLSTAPSAAFLPNPFSDEGSSLYRLDDAGLFVRYRLGGDVTSRAE